MKKQFLLTLFLISMIIVLQCKNTETNLKNKSSNVVQYRKLNLSQSEEALMKQLFSTMPTKCEDPEKSLEKAKEKALEEKKGNSYLKSSKTELWWVKKWGFGPSAYIYDYLTPVLKDEFIKEAKEIYDATFKTANDKDGEYKDPYDYNNFITDQMSEDEKNRFKSNLKLINANYVKEIFDVSINAVQLHKVMKEWKWVSRNESGDYSKDFVDLYDSDGDGRLNVREFILAVIDYNRKNYSNGSVKKIFNSCIKLLNAIFTFVDCNDDGFLTAEELWKNLKQLKRTDDSHYNIFGANESLRMTAINDFILKSHESKNGLLSKEEFIAGILLGYWNRQVDLTKVLTDDSRNLIHLRWDNKVEDKDFKNKLK